MSCSCSTSSSSNSLVNGVQNQVLDLFNRTSYLSSPYAIGPPLSTYTPSSALSVAPVQGCGGYSFVSPALGPASPLGVSLASGAPGPVSPPVGLNMVGLPSIMGGSSTVSVPNGNTTLSVGMGGGNMNLAQGGSFSVSSGSTINVPPGTTNINVNPNNNSGNNSVGPVSPFSNMLNQGSSSSIQRPAPVQQNTTAIVGVPSSSVKNLVRATGGDTTSDQSYSPSICTTNGGGCPTDTCTGSVQTTVNNPPPPVPVAPGVVAGGVGGIALASPAFLGGTPNINVTSGIAFANDCGTNYGIRTPLAVQGPIAPPINVLGSNYLNNFASQPYYSGLNNSEPAAIMNSANPLYPGFVMVARAWNGTPEVIVSKPDAYGCPQFETITPFLDPHNHDCECEKCNIYTIDDTEYRCINGFGEAIPGSDSTNLSLVISPLGTVTTKTIAKNEFYFVVQKANLATNSSILACRNEDNLCIAVNGVPNKNILMFKGCTYRINFVLDTNNMPAGVTGTDLRLIFTNDPCGKKCDTEACNNCTSALIDCNFGPGVMGVQPGQKFSYTPSKDCHSSCLSTIYYQIKGIPYSGGPITII